MDTFDLKKTGIAATFLLYLNKVHLLKHIRNVITDAEKLGEHRFVTRLHENNESYTYNMILSVHDPEDVYPLCQCTWYKKAAETRQP